MKYLKRKCARDELSYGLSFLEYHHIGLQLCRHFGLQFNNHTLHAANASEVYLHIYQLLIQHYKITCDELVDGSIQKIYESIVFQRNVFIYF